MALCLPSLGVGFSQIPFLHRLNNHMVFQLYPSNMAISMFNQPLIPRINLIIVVQLYKEYCQTIKGMNN